MKSTCLAWALLVFAAAWIGLRWFENFMVFHPRRAIEATPSDVHLAYEKVWITASDGPRLRAWWIPGPREDAPVLLCLHGNGGNLSGRVPKMRLFRDAGAAQLWLEWRGYGESSGRPNEAGLYRDARAARDWLLRERGVPLSRLVIYGESLGSGPAVELATETPAAGLVVDSGFTSMLDMARVVLPWYPVALGRIRFDNLAKLPRVMMPTLFLHSPEDDVVPYEQSQRNFAAAAGPKRFVKLAGGHNYGYQDTPGYGAAIKGFLESLRGAR